MQITIPHWVKISIKLLCPLNHFDDGCCSCFQYRIFQTKLLVNDVALILSFDFLLCVELASKLLDA